MKEVDVNPLIKKESLNKAFLDVIKTYTAGDPMNDDCLWTHLYPKKITELLFELHGIKASQTVIKKLLQENGFRRRKAEKKRTMTSVEHRDEQFENIKQLRQQYEQDGNPIISVDTKKKEFIGNFYRAGYLYSQAPVKVNDHDYPSAADGVVIPHGIYDLQQNHGYIHIGTSYDTSQFACESLLHWWTNEGLTLYPNATSILILCDGGGSNSSHYYIFKEELQKLVDKIGIEIRIAHYPPYCSKYNPIEHLLFPHVTRACQGVIFKTVDIVKELIAQTKTSTGLKVNVEIFDKIYQKGRKASDSFKENMTIIFDDYLSKWNYRAVPKNLSTTVI